MIILNSLRIRKGFKLLTRLLLAWLFETKKNKGVSEKNLGFHVNFRFIQIVEFGCGVSGHEMTAIATGVEWQSP